MSIVDANYRFVAAAQEANARIAQRQQSLSLYVTIVLSLIAALVALGRNADTSQQSLWLLLGFPLSLLCLIFLNYKSEAALTNIRNFLSELERLGNAHERLPSFNTDARWAMNANRARRFHDFASAVLAAGSHAIGVAVAASSLQTSAAGDRLLMFTAGSGAIISVSLLLIPRWRFQPGDSRS